MAFGQQQYGYSPAQREDEVGLRREEMGLGRQRLAHEQKALGIRQKIGMAAATRPQQVTAANAPLWQARKRMSPKREMLDAYLGAPTGSDAMLGWGLVMKSRQYKARLAREHRNRYGQSLFRRKLRARGFGRRGR